MNQARASSITSWVTSIRFNYADSVDQIRERITLFFAVMIMLVAVLLVLTFAFLYIGSLTGPVLDDIATLSVIGLPIGFASNELLRSQRSSTRLSTQLRATAELAQRSTTVSAVRELLTQTVNYVRDRFGFYHVQIFINDNDQRF